MISRSFRMVPLMIIAIAASAAAQLTPVAAALDREAAERITELSAGLHFSGAGPSSRPSDADLVKVTGRVHAELDDYVATAFKATDDPNAIQARLRNVLADHRPNPEYGDLPLARVAKLGGIQSLIVAY